MKKNLFVFAAIAMLVMGCAKEVQPTDTQIPADEQKTYLKVVESKATVSGLGACAWQEGDILHAWFKPAEGDGVHMDFVYEGRFEDGSAKFATTGAVPAEFTAAKLASAAATIKTDGSGFTLVRDYVYDPDSVPVYVRTDKVERNEDGTLSANLVHNASIMQFTLRDIPAYAAGFVLYTSGNIMIKTTFPYKTGYDADIVLHTVVPNNRTVEKFYLIDGDGDEIEGTVKTFTKSPVSQANEFIEMGLVDFQKENLRKDYIKVCGIKWAKGNLQSKSTFAETGFQPRWRIAPTQWHNFKYESAAAADQASPARYDYTNSGDEFEHFNFGGIQRNARFYSDGNFLKPAAALEISGKIFSDKNGTAEVTGDNRFKEISATVNSDIWGDLAFWASKGKYRMPTNAEMTKFHNVSDKLLGYYVTSDGHKVWGVLLRTPNPRRTTSSTYAELTDADLESGVFLPNAGRRSNGASNTVIAVTLQGTYRTGNYIKSKTVSDEVRYYSSYYHSENGAKLYDGTLATMGDAYDNAAGFLIRPVLVD